MDIIKMNYLKKYETLHGVLNSFKFILTQLEALTESITYITPDELEDAQIDAILSSICTKWMQLNVGFAKIKNIEINTHPDHMENHVIGTANQFVLYSILDEFQFNDSKKPFDTAEKHGSDSVRFGFISHIDDVARGLAYILDESLMPDPSVLYGSAPKRLSRLPMPGEMFAYLYQDKYLVRAIRLEYEYLIDTNRLNQFSAKLIDIGCVVHIDIKPNLHGFYEVTSAAKIIPGYTKLTQLCDIPVNMCVYDLLHSRVQYKVLHSNNEKIFANILKEVINPFVEKQQKVWNFYEYFLPHNVNLMSPQKPPRSSIEATPIKSYAPIQPTITSLVPIKSAAKPKVNLNPFADTSQYQIEDITYVPVIDKNNPFYYDPNEEVVGKKPKFQNFRLTKILNKLSDEWVDKNLSNIPTIKEKTETFQEKANESMARKKLTYGMNDLYKLPKNDEKLANVPDTLPKKNSTEAVAPRSVPASEFALEKPVKTNIQVNQLNDLDKPTKNDEKVANVSDIVPKKKIVEAITPRSVPASAFALEKPVKMNIQANRLDEPAHELEMPKKTVATDCHYATNENQLSKPNTASKSPSKSLKGDKSHKDTRSTKMNIPAELVQVKPKIVKRKDFPPLQKPPKIGDTIMVLLQHLISAEEFYAVIRKDPTRDLEVEEFALYFNFELNRRSEEMVRYDVDCTPKLFDKVIALYEDGSFYRAQVVKVVDTHVFQVFYVDYGNCANAITRELLHYQDEWDEYPAYALHFRIRNVREINQWDREAYRATQQLLNEETKATVIDIVHDEQINRTTYVVDLIDRNGLSIAEVLATTNHTLFMEPEQKTPTKPVGQANQACIKSM